MCGIAGYIGRERLPDDRVEACLSLMSRRGPDARDSYRHAAADGRHVLLLHSRLSIIDLDAHANQPFSAGGNTLVFNGEIYNYLELRKELQANGSAFHTNSDTEVLLQALRTWDGDALSRCEGMWAFASYDEKSGTLLLSRDRFGEKPLFLYRDKRGLYFASEVKFIRALVGKALAPNLNHLFRYLVNGYKALYKTSETFFVGVEELPAGTNLTVLASGSEETARYWRPAFEQDAGMSYAHAVEGARAALIESVRLRLRADVPMAFCMSGGVDSNALVSIAKRVFGYDVHGFTIVNTDARYEEQDMVDCAVRELGVRHTSIPLRSEGFMDGLRRLVAQHDAPVYTISYYVQWLLMEAVRGAGYRISVSGTAADELFSGYYDHHNLYLAGMRQGGSAHSEAMANWKKWIAPIVRNPYLQDPDVFATNPGLRDHIYLDADKLAAYLRKPWSEAFTEERYTGDLLRNRMANELFHESVPVILHEDDHNAMYYSIENRSPFLDSGLFDHCSRIPSRHLIKDGMAKSVLRDAMRDIVPSPILDNRRKVGFNAPVLDLLDVADEKVRSAVLADGPIFDYVRRERVAALLDKGPLPNSESKFLFNFLCARIFLEHFDAGSPGTRAQ